MPRYIGSKNKRPSFLVLGLPPKQIAPAAGRKGCARFAAKASSEQNYIKKPAGRMGINGLTAFF
jgi:hypothetical protein